jgi:DNA-binding CsgD family transcriptional regulator
MSGITQVREWHGSLSNSRTYEQLLTTLGTAAFGPAVREAVMAQTAGARRVYLFEATARDRTTLHYCSVESAITPLLPAYLAYFQPVDPLGDLFLAAPLHGDLALQRVVPADIASDAFRHRFFDAPGIVERIAIIQRGAAGWRGINIARHRSTGPCSDVELESLLALACLVLPMLPAHRRRDSRLDAPDIVELEARFARRHAGLTERERQVCARAAAGLGIDATARDLGIARTSVLTYRQRAYQRLGVSSTVALRALVTH